MTVAFAPDQIQAPHVLSIPGVPPSTRQATLRAEILGRLAGTVASFEDPETLLHWNTGLYHEFRPRNSWHQWLTQQAALYMMRIDRADRIERRLRDIQALRAIDCWEADQEQAAHALGANLAADPARTVAALWCTPAGCQWMIEKWATLAETPADAWDAAQAALAQQLCPASPDHHRTPGYARMRILNLEVMRDRLRAADESCRHLVESDLGPEPSTMLANLRRYTRALHRQLRWFLAQLRLEPPKREPLFRFHPDHDRLTADAADEAAPTAGHANPASGPAAADRTDPATARAAESRVESSRHPRAGA